MKILFVDDESSSHINFCQNVNNRDDITSLNCFFNAEDALSFASQNTLDCAFMDISLGGDISGLELAKKIKELQPHIEVAFLTAFDEYTKDSYQIGGRAYLTKPYPPQELDAALDLMGRLIQTRPLNINQTTDVDAPIRIRTFGNFDLIIDGRAFAFKTAKAKEALAYLVDQMGSSASGAQIFFALWENQEYNATTSIYVRRTMRALKEELAQLGLAEALNYARNSYSIDITKWYCDSYALLNGGQKEAVLFNGEYMKQYAWGEMTIPLLDRTAKKLIHT